MLAHQLGHRFAHGIAFGFVSYAAIKLLAGRAREVPVTVWVLAAVFVAKFGWLA